MDERAPRRTRLQTAVPGGGDADLRDLPDRVLASWQRSEEYGVSLDTVEPVFTGTLDDESLFYTCGHEVLSGLQQDLAGQPISLMLTDADGLVLNRFSGDAALLRSLDAVHLAPGFSYSEREAGTNGLGLALADRSPTLVRAEQHYSLSLCSYTCAAVPVLDPLSGRLDGCVNLTTWATTPADMLLALAHSAASNTAALMLARGAGRRPRPTPRGEVFRVETPQLEPGSGTLQELSEVWRSALRRVERAAAAGRVVAAVGEPGSGRATLLAQATRGRRPGARILSASTPAPEDTEAWLSLWTPEVGKPHTSVLVCRVDNLPVWAAERLRDLLGGLSEPAELSLTAEWFEDIPAPLAGLVDTVVQVPSLRERPEDVAPLADHIARRVRGRAIDVSPAARRAMRDHEWPGNVSELAEVVRQAALHTDLIDLPDLPAALLSGASHRLSRIEVLERDEIVRVLSSGQRSRREAAESLGMSRATLYRKIARYDIRLPR